MYEDKKKTKKIYVESKCVSRDDCCWDETPEALEVVTVNLKSEHTEWPEHWQKARQLPCRGGPQTAGQRPR